jgi:hypothetical protein
MSCAAPTAVALALLASVAAGDETEDLIQQGVELRHQGRDREALELFARAHLAAPTPRSAAQLGLAEQALGRWVDAEQHLRAALAADDPWVAENREPLEASLAFVAQHLAELEVIGPPGATLSVDGRAVATLPMGAPVRVVAGLLAIEVRAPGRLPVARSVLAQEGQRARETVELAPLPQVAAPAPASAPAARPRARWWWWAIGGAALVAVVAAAVAVPLALEAGAPLSGSLGTLKVF